MTATMQTDDNMDEQLIWEVMAACKCTEAHASKLLKLAKGDAATVITRHKKTLERYGLPRSPSNALTPHETTIFRQNDKNDSFTAARSSTSTYECFLNTPEPTSLIPQNQEDNSAHSEYDDILSIQGGQNLEQGTADGPPEPQWSEQNFELPIPPAMLVPVPGELVQAERLVSYLYHGNIEHNLLASYLNQSKDVSVELNSEVLGFPTVFYAAAINDDAILRMWIDHGADLNAVHSASGTPLLAFVVLLAAQIEGDTTNLVATLLSLGASPSVIPDRLYTPFVRDPDGDVMEIAPGEFDYSWCKGQTKQKLLENLNLIQRYYLERATYLRAPSARFRQIAADFEVKPLLGLQYFLIGQTLAANALLEELETDLAMREAGHRHEPLVLAFAGPSGHGKTELARQMGHLLNLPLEVVDCTTVNKTIELFGGRHPYMGAEKGSPLNNFLAAHSGRPCIVFLDEFEKTTQDIHHSLLLPFDNGVYEDRRNGDKIDCTETIWIFATNALDKIITQFCNDPENAPIMSVRPNTKRDRLQKKLSRALKEEFLRRFEAPITGRISEFIPFLPFSNAEQAVVARKYLLNLEKRMRRPVVMVPKEDRRLLGDINLVIKHDGALCEALASSDYHPELGARSLARGVRAVQKRVVAAYLDAENPIAEQTGLVDYIVNFRDGEISIIKSGEES